MCSSAPKTLSVLRRETSVNSCWRATQVLLKTRWRVLLRECVCQRQIWRLIIISEAMKKSQVYLCSSVSLLCMYARRYTWDLTDTWPVFASKKLSSCKIRFSGLFIAFYFNLLLVQSAYIHTHKIPLNLNSPSRVNPIQFNCNFGIKQNQERSKRRFARPRKAGEFQIFLEAVWSSVNVIASGGFNPHKLVPC